MNVALAHKAGRGLHLCLWVGLIACTASPPGDADGDADGGSADGGAAGPGSAPPAARDADVLEAGVGKDAAPTSPPADMSGGADASEAGSSDAGSGGETGGGMPDSGGGGILDAGAADAGRTPIEPGVSPCDPQVAFFCDDFEEATVGDAPRPPWEQNDDAKITMARAWSGSKAVEIAEGSAALNLDLDPPRDVLFVRLLLWTSFEATTQDSRLGLIEVSAGSHIGATDADPNLVSFHVFSNGEDALDSTTALPLSQWVCLEASYDRTTAIFRAWVNGEEAKELNQPLGGSAIPSGWTHVAFRNVVFHDGSATTIVDDVALGTDRIGCPTM